MNRNRSLSKGFWITENILSCEYEAIRYGLNKTKSWEWSKIWETWLTLKLSLDKLIWKNNFSGWAATASSNSRKFAREPRDLFTVVRCFPEPQSTQVSCAADPRPDSRTNQKWRGWTTQPSKWSGGSKSPVPSVPKARSPPPNNFKRHAKIRTYPEQGSRTSKSAGATHCGAASRPSQPDWHAFIHNCL